MSRSMEKIPIYSCPETLGDLILRIRLFFLRMTLSMTIQCMKETLWIKIKHTHLQFLRLCQPEALAQGPNRTEQGLSKAIEGA
jgi:hypothetical protein